MPDTLDTRHLPFVGPAPLQQNDAPIDGSFVEIDGHTYYRIRNADRLDPFFVTVVSADDHWLFASSTGSLTAGRRTPEHALFPYETVDRIHAARDRTGGTTVLLVSSASDGQERSHLWEPFSDRYRGLYRTRRNIYKSILGDRLLFEEINDDLGLTFRSSWTTSRAFGFVRTAEVENHSSETALVRLLDGIQNLMPYGIPRSMHDTTSVLTDAYRRNELRGSGLGIFALSAQPVDRAEPSEALKTTTVWQHGLDPDAILLSARQLEPFRRTGELQTETHVRAARGAYLLGTTLELGSGSRRSWTLVADVDQNAADVVRLDAALDASEQLLHDVQDDVQEGHQRLQFLISTADGEQTSGDEMTAARQRMNVLYNIMRGGVFDEGYRIRREALRAFLAHHNAEITQDHADLLDGLPEVFSVEMLRGASSAASPQFQRLCSQYLPLHFSRRHGDPSRPWNTFTIDVRDDAGELRRGYEGNWRDIFQNWEALGRSFPHFLEGMVTTFVNASTVDGYNPYRITDRGIDWERVDPEDPWSFIGYWGDHQIIYLLRLLVQLDDHQPDRLAELLSARRFCYANVPYRIKPYDDIRKDPQDTIEYDAEADARIEERVASVGADGKLLWNDDGEVLLVSLAEKLLVPLLAKMTNLVPGGGIWMNTQRPEWNDANNALVGNGLSVVTLFSIRRYLSFLQKLLADGEATHLLSVEVADLLADVADIITPLAESEDGPLSATERERFVTALGEAGTAYRERIYANGLSGRTREVSSDDIQELLRDALTVVDRSLAENRRDDGLFHSYNLLEAHDGAISVEHLYLMLEGQVSALDAGYLEPAEAVDLLQALRESGLFRPDQHSYMLYPDRKLPDFVEKNTLPLDATERVPLFGTLVEEGDTSLVVGDVEGKLHFNGSFRNRDDVIVALDALRERAYADAVERDRQAVLDLFEETFNHHAYTGRSGTFFGYEGLGSIYWHMVSKLALAVQENCFRAAANGTDEEVTDRLVAAYYDVRSGLGGSKSPEEYGAFPMDAYSHTPGHAGAKQPGMTGQVKEDVLCRWGELGVVIQEGRIRFEPLLLRDRDFLTEPGSFSYSDQDGERRTIDLEEGSLAFTYCATPFVYRKGAAWKVTCFLADGGEVSTQEDVLSPELSAEIFGRTGEVRRVEVEVPEHVIRRGHHSLR